MPLGTELSCLSMAPPAQERSYSLYLHLNRSGSDFTYSATRDVRSLVPTRESGEDRDATGSQTLINVPLFVMYFGRCTSHLSCAGMSICRYDQYFGRCHGAAHSCHEVGPDAEQIDRSWTWMDYGYLAAPGCTRFRFLISPSGALDGAAHARLHVYTLGVFLHPREKDEM